MEFVQIRCNVLILFLRKNALELALSPLVYLKGPMREIKVDLLAVYC